MSRSATPATPPIRQAIPTPPVRLTIRIAWGSTRFLKTWSPRQTPWGGLGVTQHSRGANKPATRVSWFEAAAFVNWLNTSTGNTPAYKFVVGSFQLWAPGDAGYDANNLFRNSQAKYFLPSTDEWYKAAYFDPNTSVYYGYPTGSNDAPDGIDFVGDTDFDAVFFDGAANPVPNDITDVGIASPYGTMGQGGNVWEMEESEADLVNDNGLALRGMRGGHWSYAVDKLQSSSRLTHNPASEGGGISFRVASISEPTPGDANGDGHIDGNDYLIWAANFGVAPAPNPPGPPFNADFNEDTVVDGLDYLIWAGTFGQGPNDGVAVPEPSSFFLLIVGSLMALSVRTKGA